MGYRVLAAAACLSTIFGCTTVQLMTRTAGERLLDFPEPVAEEYRCTKRRLPFIEVETSELIPKRMHPGDRLNHRFVYVMCPERVSGVIAGTLHTRIQYRGVTVHSDSIKKDLKPGRWVVDSFVTLPEQAKTGIYAIEARFVGPKGRFSFHSDFLVD
jgi:hypothetical protein